MKKIFKIYCLLTIVFSLSSCEKESDPGISSDGLEELDAFNDSVAIIDLDLEFNKTTKIDYSGQNDITEKGEEVQLQNPKNLSAKSVSGGISDSDFKKKWYISFIYTKSNNLGSNAAIIKTGRLEDGRTYQQNKASGQAVKSIAVSPGCKITLWSKNNFKGTSFTMDNLSVASGVYRNVNKKNFKNGSWKYKCKTSRTKRLGAVFYGKTNLKGNRLPVWADNNVSFGTAWQGKTKSFETNPGFGGFLKLNNTSSSFRRKLQQSSSDFFIQQAVGDANLLAAISLGAGNIDDLTNTVDGFLSVSSKRKKSGCVPLTCYASSSTCFPRDTEGPVSVDDCYQFGAITNGRRNRARPRLSPLSYSWCDENRTCWLLGKPTNQGPQPGVPDLVIDELSDYTL